MLAARIDRRGDKNVEREHFLQRHAEPSPGNLREPMPEWTGTTGGWRDGDASVGPAS